MRVIMKNQEFISELRIEGHTDSTAKDKDELLAYLYNTKLSQDRSRNVMDFCLNLREIKSNEKYMEWSFSHVTAHGMSSSERILMITRWKTLALLVEWSSGLGHEQKNV